MICLKPTDKAYALHLYDERYSMVLHTLQALFPSFQYLPILGIFDVPKLTPSFSPEKSTLRFFSRFYQYLKDRYRYVHSLLHIYLD